MTDAEREERLALRETILAKLDLLGERKDREWALMAMRYMAWHLCLQWKVDILKFWIWHLDWMLGQAEG